MNLRRPCDRFALAFLLLALGFLPPAAAAQDNGKLAVPSKPRHCLWKIEGKTNSVFLMGSVHALKAENYPLPAPLEAAFSNSHVVAFETDIAAVESPQLAFKIMAKARLPEGKTLQTELAPEVYRDFTNHLKGGGLMSAEMMEKFTPAMAALTLSVLEIQKLGLDPQNGLDKHFFPLARKAGKEIAPLETVDFQLGLMTDFNSEEGSSLMKSTLKELANMGKELDELLKAWEVGDLTKLDKLLHEAMADEPVLYKRLVTDRNKAWVPKIEEFIQSGKNAVVIVGAAHLVGKEGVAELLTAKGYKVMQQ